MTQAKQLAEGTIENLNFRYARTDEMGIPYAITVDFETEKDNTVTLRELSSLSQIRLPVSLPLLTIDP